MKKLLIFLTLNILMNSPIGGRGAFAQSTVIEPNNMRLPSLTSSQVLAINSPQKGMMVFDTDAKCVKYYNGTEWICTSSTKGITPQNQVGHRIGSNSYEDIGICVVIDNQGNVYLAFNFTGIGSYGSFNFNTYNSCLNAYTQ